MTVPRAAVYAELARLLLCRAFDERGSRLSAIPASPVMSCYCPAARS